MNRALGVLVLVVAGFGCAAKDPDPQAALRPELLERVAALAADYRDHPEGFRAAEEPWDTATPWQRRVTVLAALVDEYVTAGEPVPAQLQRALFVSINPTRTDAEPLTTAQLDLQARLERQTAAIFETPGAGRGDAP